VSPIRLASVLFLDARRIRQHKRTELPCGRRAEHASAKALGDEPRQKSTVIEVRMGQDDNIDPRRIDRERPPITIPQLFETLEETAVDQNSTVTEVEQMLGAGDSAGGSEKRQRWRHGCAIV
jgi:hypothetical protein